MNNTSAAVKVGVTVLLIALLSFFAFKFVSKGLGGGGGYQVWALFHDATGLVDKSQVQVMIARLLGLEKIPKPADAADALGLAITHIHARKLRRLAAGA